MRRRRFPINVLAVLLKAILILPSAAHSAGYALLEQSAEGTGVGFAGATAGYDDGSAIFFNPAAMTIQKRSLVSAGGSVVSPKGRLKNKGSLTGSGHPLAGGTPDGGNLGWPPTFYTTRRFDTGLTAGFGVNSPFGLSPDYSKDWVGRYSTIDAHLFSLNMTPAVSYEVADNLALGAAVNVIYLDAELKTAIDFGSIGFATLGAPTAAKLGLFPQQADGQAKISGDDWGVGATFGISFTYDEDSRVGFSYRSRVDTNLRGDANFEVPAAAQVLTSTGSFVDTRAKADLTLPDALAFGWRHQLSEAWTLLSDVQWTHWTHFNELRVTFDSGQPDLVIDESWKNAWRFSFGTEYRLLTRMKLRGGFTFDEEAIPNKFHRTPTIPGNDRYWLAIGMSYQFTKSTRADVAYAHLFVPNADSDLRGSTGETLVGTWRGSVDIVSAQLVYAF